VFDSCCPDSGLPILLGPDPFQVSIESLADLPVIQPAAGPGEQGFVRILPSLCCIGLEYLVVCLQNCNDINKGGPAGAQADIFSEVFEALVFDPVFNQDLVIASHQLIFMGTRVTWRSGVYSGMRSSGSSPGSDGGGGHGLDFVTNRVIA
jgi:hypothetical protein